MLHCSLHRRRLRRAARRGALRACVASALTDSFFAFDQAISDSGRIALWAEEDNVTRFDRLTIKSLPVEEP